MTKVGIAIPSISPAAVAMGDYHDWTARKAASYGRVLESALAKIKKETEIASYSNLPTSITALRDVIQASGPASECEWDPKTELQTKSLIAQKALEKPKKQGYGAASASRRKGIDLQPRRPSAPKVEGLQPSVFDNYRQNHNLRKTALLQISVPSIRPHYNVVLQHHESILKQKSASRMEIPTLQQLSARAFGRAIIMARDPSDLEGDSKWYAYCDENSMMYRFLADTIRGHITQLLVDAVKQDWFPEDLAATLIAQSVNAGDSYLTEVIFRAAYENTYDGIRPVARRRGELAPDPFAQILYMPDVLFRQLRIATDVRPEMMLDAWFRDVMLAGISEIGFHMEIPAFTDHCLEMLLGLESWESGLQRRRLNRSGKQMRRKKDESFKQAWLFQAKDVAVFKATKTAEDLVERLFEVGWKDGTGEENGLAARQTMGRLVQHMVYWSEAFNHPAKALSEVSSQLARTLALCAVLMSGEELGVSAQEVAEELVDLLLVIAIENSEEPKTDQETGEQAETFDIRDLADSISGTMRQVWSSFDRQKEFMESLLSLAVEDTKLDEARTPAPIDKSKLLQKRQSYLLATFAYHLATSIAESSKLDAAHAFATKVEQTLVGMKIWRGGLLKASDLKTPKFSNLVRDLALTDARNSGWQWEPMLNDWVEGSTDSDCDKSGNDGKVVRKVSRKLFTQRGTRSQVQALATYSEESGASGNPFGPESDSESSDCQEGDTSIYPASVDTTLTEPDVESPGSPRKSASSSFLLEVCIQSKDLAPAEYSPVSESGGCRVSKIFRQVKRTRSGSLKEAATGCGNGIIAIRPISSRRERVQEVKEDDAIIVDTPAGNVDSVISGPQPRKRGRPRKNTLPSINVQAVCQSSHDSAYEPNDDDDYEQTRRQTKKTRLSLGQLIEEDRSYQTRSAQKRMRNLDIYQDELDLTSSVPSKSKKEKRWSTGAIILGDAGKSKLNEKLNAEKRKRKSDGPDIIKPAGRGRPRSRIS